MIRLIILALGIFIIWVLFVSGFSKQRKIIISVFAVLISIAGLWFEQWGEVPKDNLISVSQVVDCGVTGAHSYRTNYSIRFCLQNNATDATLKRAKISFSALNCESGECREIESVIKEIPLDVAPRASATMVESLSFNKLESTNDTIVWTVTPVKVKGVL